MAYTRSAEYSSVKQRLDIAAPGGSGTAMLIATWIRLAC